ncbi:50S ribosomal protein L3 [Patescibacteria group bacterium]|jgi:large subunit ribosomal protein L3|nr:50S ribosomal protein L3 [Patescibacteria group bacterium]
MKFVLGTKQEMTQIFDAQGRAWPGTILRIEPSKVTQVKTVETDGYASAQIASGAQKEQRLSKALVGHLKGAFKTVREFRPQTDRNETLEGIEFGATIDASIFAPGDKVVVSAISKGKGFQGVVKRHGFAGDKASHGRKHSMRTPGSIGGGGRAGGRVIKGMRMAGRMGGDRITVKNLRVLQVNAAENVLVIGGAIPGRRGTVVEIRAL